MTERRRLGRWLLAAYLVASAGVLGATAVVLAQRQAQARHGLPEPESDIDLTPPDRPIAAEAGVFRTHAGVLAIPPGTPRLRDAHPRTLARARLLRAYPGAPPRMPHGVTADEYRTGECNTCHERGGFSPRFGAYAPVTPHPEMPACLQCHVGSDAVTNVSLPSLEPSAICRQCHAPGASRWSEATIDWRPLSWPALAPRPLTGVPPMPHDLVFRENCLACHAGPSGVAEIRTGHPDWASCRSCHVTPLAGVADFTRPVAAAQEETR